MFKESDKKMLNYSPQILSRRQCNFIDFSEISVNVGMEMQQI